MIHGAFEVWLVNKCGFAVIQSEWHFRGAMTIVSIFN